MIYNYLINFLIIKYIQINSLKLNYLISFNKYLLNKYFLMFFLQPKVIVSQIVQN